MPYVALINGFLLTSWHSMYDGQYIVTYQPGNGSGPGLWTCVTTTDINKAQRYPDQPSVLAERNRVDPNNPWRFDGKPNAPLWMMDISAVSVPS